MIVELAEDLQGRDMVESIHKDDPLPNWFRQSYLYRLIFIRLWNWKRLAWLVGRRLNFRTAGGFASGMRYISGTRWGNPANKLVGTYEKELSSTWKRLDSDPPTLVFDVGAAEGYYAIGSLLRWPACRVIAWESDPISRTEMSRMAELNQVQDRISVLAECSAVDLERRLEVESPGLIIMDVEGLEESLSTPRAIQAASDAVWVIETHGRELLEGLKERFHRTHTVNIIENEKRTSEDCPKDILRLYLAYDRWRVVHEGRPIPTPWLVAWPRSPKEQRR